EEVYTHFATPGLTVVDDKNELQDLVAQSISDNSRPVCLLLMSSGTFDGIDWNNVCSQKELN
ncbi:MAG: hypothetical protein K8F30_10105, partial [Taibaiella sp.]|nr:hypothetical protein [Taibaiella sp.]